MSTATTEAQRTGAPSSAASAKRFAVVDVGSNSVRLVVFEGLVRAPLPIFNEKVMAALGKGLGESGRLNPDGEKRALSAVERFVAVSKALGAGVPEIVATAAVRDARNGPELMAEIERRTGAPARLLRGRDEARLSALGVAAAIPDADGLMGDLGGGSLELMSILKGQPGEGFTLPLGTLILAGKGRQRAGEAVDAALAPLGWMWKEVTGRTFYAVGGAWRSFARLDMQRRGYPLHIVHNYRMPAAEVASLSQVLAGLSEPSVKGLKGIDGKRAEYLPLAAIVLGRVVAASKAKAVVFSANGLREGVVQDRLTPRVRALDPLLEAVTRMAARAGRGVAAGEELRQWLAPLFAADAGTDQRLITAACYLADCAWTVHPDYRAAQSVSDVLYAPMVGIDHPGRAFVALALYWRHDADSGHDLAEIAKSLLDADNAARARRLGLGLRLALTLSGGGAGILSGARLSLTDGSVKMLLTGRTASLAGEKVERRLADVAEAFGRKPQLAAEV